jgi:hypothetical protein
MPTRFVDLAFLLSKAEIDDSMLKCMVCLSDYEDKEEVRTMPCMHYFHKICIDKWLLSRGKHCPICKFDIKRNYNAISIEK